MIHLCCCTVCTQANINAFSRSSILTTFGQVDPDCIKIIMDTTFILGSGFANVAFSERENADANIVASLEENGLLTKKTQKIGKVCESRLTWALS